MGFFSRKQDDGPPKAIAELLDSVSLPSFPRAAQQALDALRNQNSSPKDIASALEKDPKLSVLILKTVNSAAFAVKRPVDSVQHASVLMGRAPLESMLLGVVVADLVKVPSTGGLEPSSFWRAAARRATAAKEFARRIRPEIADQSFTAALLEDIAVPLLATHDSNSYKDVLTEWRTTDVDLATIEKAAFGHSHGDVGFWVARHFGLPVSLVDLVRSHHDPDESRDPAHVVSVVTDVEGMPSDTAIESMVQRSGLAETDVRSVVDTAWSAADDLAALFVR